MTSPLLRVVSARDALPSRSRGVDQVTLAAASAILDDINTRGDAAVLDHAHRLGDLATGAPVLLGRTDLRAAFDRLLPDAQAVLSRSATRIRNFADAQRRSIQDLTINIAGGAAGHTLVPVQAAGCYAPGGRFPLPSSVLMTAITARAAGVPSVWVASPRPTDTTLAAAYLADVDGVLAIGGVQGVAALARGLIGVPVCDMIVGPGNRWVTAAKWLLSGEVGIDMLAGPSELLVLADEDADPSIVAADLLAQAEHDDDAIPMLVSTSAALVGRVETELCRQLQDLPTAPTAIRALANGFATVAESLAEALSICDAIAPEHLEILTREPLYAANHIRNAGAVFIGSRSAEVLGDYGAGPNHVLPTGGTARFKAGLSVFTFLRARTWLRIDDAAAGSPIASDAAALARMERLEAHARSAETRLSPAQI